MLANIDHVKEAICVIVARIEKHIISAQAREWSEVESKGLV
jgi:hypothetical protein